MIDHLIIANKVTKALFPDLYGKPGLTTGQVALLMGSRGIILEILKKEIAEPDSAPEQVEPPRCPKCGYTNEDCLIHMDHHLCGEPTPSAKGEQR